MKKANSLRQSNSFPPYFFAASISAAGNTGQGKQTTSVGTAYIMTNANLVGSLPSTGAN